MQTLQQGITLQGGKYIIKKVLGQGGFGITYLAEHDLLGTNVAIKEFFMKDLNNRDEETLQVSTFSGNRCESVERFKAKFLKEARNIFQLNHPNIISILDIFEENGTAYYVMEYCKSGSLSDLLKQYPQGLPEDKSVKYIREVASAVAYIHEKKMNHLDIKPANIVINSKGEAILIDFGLSKQYDAETREQTSTTPVGISEGYAPLEQYNKGGVGEFSPSTDIYALGATLYKLITGQTPPSASVVNEEGLPDFKASPKIKKTILAAMHSRRADRPQTVKEWLAILEKRSFSKKKFGIGFVAVIVLTFIILAFYHLFSKPTTGKINGHDWVDLGLSVKWATCNIGASEPSEAGGYYAWGETHVKSNYDWTNCFDCLDRCEDERITAAEQFLFEMFGPEDSSWRLYKEGDSTTISPSSGHDAARENWGSTWRMPTDAENEELCTKCTWKWISNNGNNGYLVTGPNGNSIFLPAGGHCNGTETCEVDSWGRYWSNTLQKGLCSFARILSFGPPSPSSTNNSSHKPSFVIVADPRTGPYCRKCGLSVRPVTE